MRQSCDGLHVRVACDDGMLSSADAFSQIIASEGVSTLWNGVLPSLVLVFNPAVQFMFYEAMKRKAGRGGRKASQTDGRRVQVEGGSTVGQL